MRVNSRSLSRGCSSPASSFHRAAAGRRADSHGSSQRGSSSRTSWRARGRGAGASAARLATRGAWGATTRRNPQDRSDRARPEPSTRGAGSHESSQRGRSSRSSRRARGRGIEQRLEAGRARRLAAPEGVRVRDPTAVAWHFGAHFVNGVSTGGVEERQREFRMLPSAAEPRPASNSLMPSQTMRAQGARTCRTVSDRSPRRCSR
jgi:hypothetical protein